MNNRNIQWVMLAGYSLVEILVALAVLGLLAAIAVPAYQDYLTRAEVAEGLIAVDRYRLDIDIPLATTTMAKAVGSDRVLATHSASSPVGVSWYAANDWEKASGSQPIGALSVVMSLPGKGMVTAFDMELRANRNWHCQPAKVTKHTSFPPLEAKYLPPECREGAALLPAVSPSSYTMSCPPGTVPVGGLAGGSLRCKPLTSDADCNPASLANGLKLYYLPGGEPQCMNAQMALQKGATRTKPGNGSEGKRPLVEVPTDQQPVDPTPTEPPVETVNITVPSRRVPDTCLPHQGHQDGKCVDVCSPGQSLKFNAKHPNHDKFAQLALQQMAQPADQAPDDSKKKHTIDNPIVPICGQGQDPGTGACTLICGPGEALSPVTGTCVTRPKPNTCHACKGPRFICERSHVPATCPSPAQQWCINDVENLIDGSRYVSRRCATAFEVAQIFEQTGLLPNSPGNPTPAASANGTPTCNNYGLKLVDAHFSCQFVCTGANCNIQTVPGTSVNRMGQSTSHYGDTYESTCTLSTGGKLPVPKGQDAASFCKQHEWLAGGAEPVYTCQ